MDDRGRTPDGYNHVGNGSLTRRNGANGTDPDLAEAVSSWRRQLTEAQLADMSPIGDLGTADEPPVVRGRAEVPGPPPPNGQVAPPSPYIPQQPRPDHAMHHYPSEPPVDEPRGFTPPPRESPPRREPSTRRADRGTFDERIRYQRPFRFRQRDDETGQPGQYQPAESGPPEYRSPDQVTSGGWPEVSPPDHEPPRNGGPEYGHHPPGAYAPAPQSPAPYGAGPAPPPAGPAGAFGPSGGFGTLDEGPATSGPAAPAPAGFVPEPNGRLDSTQPAPPPLLPPTSGPPAHGAFAALPSAEPPSPGPLAGPAARRPVSAPPTDDTAHLPNAGRSTPSTGLSGPDAPQAGDPEVPMPLISAPPAPWGPSPWADSPWPPAPSTPAGSYPPPGPAHPATPAGASYQGGSYQGGSYQGGSYPDPPYPDPPYPGTAYPGTAYPGTSYPGVPQAGPAPGALFQPGANRRDGQPAAHQPAAHQPAAHQSAPAQQRGLQPPANRSAAFHSGQSSSRRPVSGHPSTARSDDPPPRPSAAMEPAADEAETSAGEHGVRRAADLPRRQPAEPDVPICPGVDPDILTRPDGNPAETPELARIADFLREEDVSEERRDGFDFPAVLEAVRGVVGVRDAELVTATDGMHTLRLDLADDADPGWVSRAVARLLKEQMGVSAEPTEPPLVPPPSVAAQAHRAGAARSAAPARPSAEAHPEAHPEVTALPESSARSVSTARPGPPAEPAPAVRPEPAPAADAESDQSAEPAELTDGVDPAPSRLAGLPRVGEPPASTDGVRVGAVPPRAPVPGPRAGGRPGDSRPAMPEPAVGFDEWLESVHPGRPRPPRPAVRPEPPTSEPASPAEPEHHSLVGMPMAPVFTDPSEPAGRAVEPVHAFGTAETAVPVPASAPPPFGGSGTGGRVRLEHVEIANQGMDAFVQVRLSSGSAAATGSALGPAVDSFVLRLCANATAAALDSLLTDGGTQCPVARCYVEHATVVSLGTCEVALVVLLLVSGGWVEQLTGAALVAGDPRQAVVRATLAAANRRLDALLP